jgi:type II secretion system protein N
MDQAGRKPRWGRRLGIIAVVLVVLLVAFYFVATSGFFLKSVILPKVGKSMNATITVADASIAPFSQVVLRDLKVTTTSPLIEAREARLRYKLIDIIKGHINVDELTLDSPMITLVKEIDGKSNLDPILKQPKKSEDTSKKGNTELDVKNVTLKNGTARVTQKTKGGQDVTEIGALNISLDQLKNGGSGKLTIASDLRMDQAGTNHLAGKISGAYDFALTPALGPQSVKGSTRIEVNRADGALKEANGLVAFLEADASPTSVNNAAFRFEKSGQNLGQLRVHGPFDMAKMEGSLTVELLSLDRNVLNLAGIDFAQSKINSTNRIDISRGGNVVAVDGGLKGTQLGVIRDNTPTPPVDLDANYKLTADLEKKSALIDRLLVSGRRENKEFLSARTDQPLNVNWGGTGSAVKDSVFRLTVTNLNFADWKTLLGTNPPAGIVNAGLLLKAQEDGRKLGIDLNATVDQFDIGTNAMKNVTLALAAKGTLEDMKRAQLPDFSFSMRSNNAPSVDLKGNARYDLEKKNIGLQATANLPPLPNTSANRLTVGLALDAGMPGDLIDLRDLSLKLDPTPRAENRLQIQAKLDLGKTNPAPATITVKSTGLDLTKYYDQFAGDKTQAAKENKTAPAATPSATGSTNPNTEPAAIDLPIKRLTANVAIDKLFLRDVAISNWVATASISNNTVRLNPLKLGVNGGPVSGEVNLNLGVAGYGYDLNLKVDRVPLEPFANSFATTNSGQYKGFLVADASIHGAGTTGANLQKSLQGQANFSATNLDLQIVGPRLKKILTPISIVLRAPELLQTPINWIDARTQMGGGKIHVEKMGVQSEAFYANVIGDMVIEKILTNSTLNLPVDLQLRRSLAQKAMLLPKDTPADAKYASLPKFVTIKGTLGNPETDINKMAVLGVGVNAISGLTGNAAVGTAGAALNAITGGGSSTNGAGTNTTSKLIQGIGGLLGGNRATNAPVSTNASPATAPATNSPAQNLLNIFRKNK